MCGIVGYLGARSASDLVFEGLKTLEYRGYDSAGISIMAQNGPFTQKAKGKMSHLEPLLSLFPQSCLAIGHTRWATHGEPSEVNAHPHSNNNIAIVHNGIIENYESLKLELIRDGVQFKSETDTEVVLHLLTREIRTNSIKNSIINVLKKLDGAYALGIMFSSDPDSVYVVREGSPITIGIGDEEMFFASSVCAFVDHTKTAVFLDDSRIARITRSSIDVWNFEGDSESYRQLEIDWRSQSVDKQEFDHFMLKEIHEQPTVVSQTLVSIRENIPDFPIDLQFQSIHTIIIVGCGTAYHAGLVSKYFWDDTYLNVHVEIASEFKGRKRIGHGRETLVIAISQSGETADTLACVRLAKTFGCRTVAVCNTPHSTLTREVDKTILMDAGVEVGVAATKSFVSQILCLYSTYISYLLNIANCEDPAEWSWPNTEWEDKLKELEDLPDQIEQVLAQSETIQSLAESYAQYSSHLFIGRGVLYPIALEGALKLKEISYMHAEGYPSGELKHGPIALIDENMPIMAITSQHHFFDKMVSNIEECIARKGLVIVVADQHINLAKTSVIQYPETNNIASQAILAAVVTQLYAYYAALKRGTDIDQPRNLAKSVTVE